jgi:2-furoyl-CoA dehydrogenase large subunit
MRRVEDGRLLRGQGHFVGNLRPFARTHDAAIVRSPHPHARILSIDPERSLRLPGVVTVLTGTDVAAWCDPFPVVVEPEVRYFPLAIDRARFVGEPVAVVVAEDRYVAEDAAALMAVEYEPLPAVVDPERALATDAPRLHENLPDNIACHRDLRYGDVEAAFATAGHVVRKRIRFPKYGSTPLETYAVIARHDATDNSYEVWTNFQGPFMVLGLVAKALRIPEHRLRFLIPPDSGGAFGIKISMFPYIALISLAARKAGVPVRWIEDRGEHLAASSSGTDRSAELEAAVDAEGRIQGVRMRLVDNVGGYIRAPEPGCLFRPLGNQVGPYAFRNLEVDAFAVMTNKSPTGPNRGYGCQHLYFGLERLVEEIAKTVQLDPIEVRRRNFIPHDAFPYETPTGGVYDSGDFQSALEGALELAGYEDLLERRRQERESGRLFGIGVATVVDPSVSNLAYVTIAYSPERRAKALPRSGASENAMITVDPSGNATVVINTVPEGEGHETAVTQLVADELGIDPGQIRVVADFDSSARAWALSSGSYSSRFASVAASAVIGAARRIREKMVAIAAHMLKADPESISVSRGGFVVDGHPDTALSFARVAGLAHWNPHALPEGMEPGLQASCMWGFDSARPPDAEDRVNSSQTYGFCVEVVAVSIDPRTCRVEIESYTSFHDSGRILNPLIVEGQVHGAITHGIGGALYEEMAYDDEGRFLSPTLMDYLCPTASDVPEFRLGHIATPSPINLTGSKGVGESSAMSAPVAIANAVNDALAPLGLVIDELPITPDKIWRLLHQEAQGAQG